MSKTKTIMYNGKEVEVLDCTPTWQGLLPGLLAVIQDGNAEGRKLAKEEFKRIAKAADDYNELVKEYNGMKDLLTICLSAFNELPNKSVSVSGERSNTYAIASLLGNALKG